MTTLRQVINKLSDKNSTEEEVVKSFSIIFTKFAQALNIDLDSQLENPNYNNKNKYRRRKRFDKRQQSDNIDTCSNQ